MRLFLFLILAVAAQAGDASFAEISEIKGDVTVQSRPAVAGPLEPGDLVEVAAGGSCRLEFADRSTATLAGHDGEGASLKLPAQAEGAAAQVLKLAKGAIAINVPPESQSKWQVETENCTASVEGTVFAVAVEPKGKGTRVLVAEGKVKVMSKHGEVVVGKGNQTAVAPDKEPSKPEDYDFREALGEMVDKQQSIKAGKDRDRR